MRSVETLRACSRCLQGRVTARSAFTSVAGSSRSALDNIPLKSVARRPAQVRAFRCSPPARTEQSKPHHIPPPQLATPGNLDPAKPDIHALIASASDITSLIALLPEVEIDVWEGNISEAIDVLAAVLRKMGDLNALALLPEILRLVGMIIREAAQVGELKSAEAFNSVYLPILQALGSFSRRNILNEVDTRQNHKLHPVMHDHILVLVKDLIGHLSRLPGPSNISTPRAHRAVVLKEILELLFDERYLHAESMGFYLQYCTKHNIQRGSSIWWRCSMVALEIGDQKMAKKFDIQAAKAAKREKKVRKGRMPEDVDIIGADMDAQWSAAGDDGIESSRQDISRIMRTRHSTSFEQVVPVLEPHLHGDLDGMPNHAWSHLLNAARRDKTVDSQLLGALRDSITKCALGGHTLTAVMLGHMEKGNLDRAWQVWLDLVERQQAAPHDEGARYVDRVALSVATYICHALHGIDAALTLVDSWARRAATTSRPDSLANSILLDTRIVNIMLHLCKIEKRPNIAFRLFAASLPRWGVYTDAISLGLLLDTARYTSGSQSGQEPDIRSRLRQLADQLRPRQTGRSTRDDEAYDAYDSSGFSKGSVSVLLDQAGHDWSTENEEPPWLRAKARFEAILFTNWPWLSSIHSPLDYTHGPYAHKLRDFSSFFLTKQETIDSDSAPPLRLPSNSSFAHLVPSASTFQSYIALLGYYHLPEEIPRALACMKALDIRPKKQTMITALMYIEDVEGPRRLFSDWDDGASRLLGDGDVLKRWLKDWLGRGVPTEEEVAVYVREYMRRHQGLTA